MANNGNGMREKVDFEKGQPVTLVLKFDKGKLITNGYGESYMWSLENDRVAFVPPVVEDQRKALGIGKGEPFEVEKTGAGKRVEWRVRRLEADEPSKLEEQLRKSLAVIEAKRNGANQAANGGGQPVPAGRPENKPTDTTSPKPNSIVHTKASKLLASALLASIDAYCEAQAEANARGMQISFNGDNVQATANTLLIQIFQTRGASWLQ